ncbi:Ribosomal protein L19e family protein isoform 1 [Hibiscus syriacus]|uniref:Ribosomal protein L19e family protein isoform 1 n=1 Tax=Hibiscus syriacus TaxID=106335 RepID=A0A6A3D2X6_HIBSY|nr:uncharacterized protein LOC120114781 [Hibiscus syriacus]KAE8734178.1 Ribosomal protein L19e family protein isoform 1 [Hibiscus syriacus]
MELSLICDAVAVATSQGLGFAKLVLDRHHYLTANSCFYLSSDSSAGNMGIFHVTAGIVPIDAVAPPPVKPNSYKTLPRILLRRRRHTKRKLFTGDDSNDGEEHGFFFGSDGGDGYGNFGGGNGGGSGWNFGGFGEKNWDESPSPWTGTALDFLYEVISWIALSNCVHFAFKKMVRIVANGIDEADDREKVPM